MTGVREVGGRIDELLGSLRDDRDRAITEELVRLLVDLYGRGLRRIVEVLAERQPGLPALLAEDDLVAGLLLVHDLHPLDTDTRVQRALDTVRPYLGSHAGGVEYLGIDDAGVVHLRLAGSCHGCPSSTITVRLAIEDAIERAAPDVTSVQVEGVADEQPAKPLLQIGSHPPDDWVGADPAVEPGWVTLPAFGPPTGRPVVTEVAGMNVLVCAIRGTLFAYRDACAACDRSLADATLTGETLRCAGCGAEYDVRLAGRDRTDPSRHLDPLPLLSDSHGVRVALPKAGVR